VFYAKVRLSGVPIQQDDRDTPDMSEVSADRPSERSKRSAGHHQLTRELTMVTLDHTAPARLRAPTLVHFSYFTAAQTAPRRAKVGIRQNGSS